jgi:translocation and assembly module TamB
LKKFFLAIGLTLLLLLGLLYLALNTPYVIDRLAQRYLPEYHLHYQKISGNPLSGVALEKLSYKGRQLAQRLRLRVNPFTLLERRITVSRLGLERVDTEVLERMLGDFTAPASTGESPSGSFESGFSFPLAFELENVHLSLLPFERYGVRVDRGDLSIDSIYYDGDRFNVGRLHQVAQTSVGDLELRGTYHKRVLDVDELSLEDLDLKGLLNLIRTLSAETGTAAAPESSPPATGSEAKEAATGDIFLPRRIHAKTVRASIRSYALDERVRLDRTKIEGEGLDIDLGSFKIDAGELSLDLTSNLGTARLRLQAAPGRYRIVEGALSEVDLPGIIDLSSGEGNSSGDSNLSWDALPFVPPVVEADRLTIALRPGTLEGIDYRRSSLGLKKVTVDLHQRKILSGDVKIDLDAAPAKLRLSGDLDPHRARITSLEVSKISVAKIRDWWRKRSGSRAKERPVADKGTQASNPLPFAPPRLLIEKALLSTDPFTLDPVQVDRASIELDSMELDLPSLEIEKGKLASLLEGDLADLRLRGRLEKNRLILEEGNASRLELKQPLFERYKLPLRAEAFSPIALSGALDKDRLQLQASLHARKILTESNSSFNLDINRSVTALDWNLGEGNLTVSENLSGEIPQTPFTLEALLEQKKGGALRYSGELKSPGVDLNDSRLESLLGAPRIRFEGDLHRLSARLDAGAFEGDFRSSDLKKGLLRLESKKPLRLAHYLKLPSKLQKSRASIKAVVPVDLAKPLPLDAKVTVESNVANLLAKIRYDGKIDAEIVSDFPKKSLLHEALPNLQLTALNPLTLQAVQEEKAWRLGLKSRLVQGEFSYIPPHRKIEGDLLLAGSKIHISGSPDTTIEAEMQTPSVKALMASLNRLYRFKAPKIDGDLRVKLGLKALKDLELELDSKEFIPDSDSRIKSPIKNLQAILGADLSGKTLLLKRYSLETAGMKFYATKTSRLGLEGSKLKLQDLWINDALKITGDYDLKKRKGKLLAKASDFKIVHENANMDLSVDVTAKLEGEKVDAGGKVYILGGTLHYDLEAKQYATDEDIIILQHQKKNEENYFYKNVQLSIYIESKKPLVFKEKNLYAQLRPQLSLLKSFNGNLQLLGSVAIAKDGYYIFEGKKFVLSPSSVNFTGNPTRPLLDINLIYHRSGRTIYITVNGFATEPNLQFSSNPFMTRDQILSFILFDTVDSGSSPDDMLSLVGGGIAKSILGNLGLKVDTLVVTSNGFELGKKITDKITLLYDQREKEPRVIVRIQHSFHTESEISVGSESQSVDIIYRREF